MAPLDRRERRTAAEGDQSAESAAAHLTPSSENVLRARCADAQESQEAQQPEEPR